VEVLQTSALPLGDAAAEDSVYQVLVDLAKSYGLNFVLVAIKAKIRSLTPLAIELPPLQTNLDHDQRNYYH
jgi:hypothetical protein